MVFDFISVSLVLQKGDIKMQFTDIHAVRSRSSSLGAAVIGCVILALVMIGVVYGLASASTKIKNADSFYNIEGAYENPANKAAYIDTEYYIETFAYEKERYTGKYIYAFAIDEHDCFYVIKARESAINKLNDEIEANGSVRIYGYTHEFSDHELRGYALEVLQELFPDEGITDADLDDIIGTYELKVTKHSLLSVFFEDSFLFGGLFLILMLGILITIPAVSGYSKFIKIEHQFSDIIPMLENEMHTEGAVWLPELKMYACENYYVGFHNGIDYGKYTDLLMIYKTIHRTNFIKTGESINVLLKNGGTRQIANASTKVSLKGSKVDNEMSVLAAKAREKNPDIFLGYDAQVLADLTRRAKNGEFKEHTDNTL